MAKEYNFDPIERDIADVFRRLSKEKPNATFVYSYAYSTSKDLTKADIKGRVNIVGSKEEIETHIDEIKIKLEQGIAIEEKRKAKVYGTKKD